MVIRFKLANEVIIQGCFLPHEPGQSSTVSSHTYSTLSSASHLHEFLSSIIDGSFVLRFVTSKIANEEKKSLLALDLAPKATIVVSCGENTVEIMMYQSSVQAKYRSMKRWRNK